MALSVGEFERIFKELYKPLCLFALRFTENIDDAEDIVQQVFADVWEKNRAQVAIVHLKSYLYQAVRNRSLTLLSQAVESEPASEALAEIEDLSEEEQIYQSERDARLWEAIDRLPPERKKKLHLSVKTVENQISKALKTLRETAIRIYCFFFS